MDPVLSLMSPQGWLMAVAIVFFAGVVKGAVGFAMPLIMISGLTFLLLPEFALAALILPTLLSNGSQALRQGTKSALETVKHFRIYLIFAGICLVISAHIAASLPIPLFLGIIGGIVAVFCLIQLLGLRFSLKKQDPRIEGTVGTIAGFMGGLSGTWGPPTVLYLTALNTEKHDQMRAQGVIYGLGAITLLGAHISSGIFDASGAILSALFVPPALAGQWVGGRLLDRIDQNTFKTATLILLLIIGANLLRRAYMGT